MRRYPFILIMMAGLVLRAAAAVPGTTYPSMKTVFTDPVIGREVWRMTTDGAQHGLINAMGDQSSESSSWSPDSRYICYWKNGNSYRPQGVYMMDVRTGTETYLAPANSNVHGGQIFSADGTEVYYYHGIGSGKFDVRAVSVSTCRVRVIKGGLSMVAPQKITRNCDGTLIAIHQWGEPKQTAVLDPVTGTFLPEWGWGSGVTGEDGSQWHPSDPDVIYAVHGTKNVYNVRTLAVLNPGDVGEIAHSSWHPDGSILVGRNTYEVATAHKWTSGVYPGHPNINPADKARGWQARLVADASGADRPYLYVMTVREFVDNRFPKAAERAWAVHYSTEATNHAHPHPHFSPDGRYILWQSDAADVSAGAPPGGTGTGGIDLFIVPFAPDTADTPGTGAAPDTLINGFASAGTGTYRWSVMETGASMYTDRGYVFAGVPADLAGGALLQTAMDDKASAAHDDDFIVFTVLRDAAVSVLYTDVNAELEAAWLNEASGWHAAPYVVGSTVPGTGEAERKVMQRYVAAGTAVRMGGQGGTSSVTSMYNVVIVPGAQSAATTCEPRDTRLRPSGGRTVRFDVSGRAVPSVNAGSGICITVDVNYGTVDKELLLPGTGGNTGK